MSNFAIKARQYVDGLIAEKKRRLSPGLIDKVLFRAKVRALRIEEYDPRDWQGEEPRGTPLSSEITIPTGSNPSELAVEPELFAYTIKPESRELVIMDISGPRDSVCFAMTFDEVKGDFTFGRRLWVS